MSTTPRVSADLCKRAEAVLSAAYRLGQHDAYSDAASRMEMLAALEPEGSTFADLHRLCEIEAAILGRKRDECEV